MRRFHWSVEVSHVPNRRDETLELRSKEKPDHKIFTY